MNPRYATTRTLLEKQSRFDTLFTNIIIQDFFFYIIYLTKFLKSDSLNYLRAWRPIETLLELINKN